MLESLQFECQYSWAPVYLREKVVYQFPMDISPYMRTRYRGPAVFRWLVFRNESDEKKTAYIGEAQELCPKRLYGYLNPAPSQASNQKVNADFRNYLKEKMTIRLELCDIVEFKMPGQVAGPGLMHDKYIRRMLVSAFIIEHKRLGYVVVDL